jgi:hypothetical protein
MLKDENGYIQNNIIYEHLIKHFDAPKKFKSFKNDSGLIYKYETIGSYRNLPFKLEFLVLRDIVNLKGVDSLNKEKIYESYNIIRIEKGFRLIRK